MLYILCDLVLCVVVLFCLLYCCLLLSCFVFLGLSLICLSLPYPVLSFVQYLLEVQVVKNAEAENFKKVVLFSVSNKEKT